MGAPSLLSPDGSSIISAVGGCWCRRCQVVGNVIWREKWDYRYKKYQIFGLQWTSKGYVTIERCDIEHVGSNQNMTFLQSKQLYCDLPRDDATLVQRCGADIALKIFIILATPSVIDFELVCGSFAITNMKSLPCIHVCSTHIHQHYMDVLGFSWVSDSSLLVWLQPNQLKVYFRGKSKQNFYDTQGRTEFRLDIFHVFKSISLHLKAAHT